MKMISTVITAIIGGITGAIAKFIEDGFTSGLFPERIGRCIVVFLFRLAPRSAGDARIAVKSFSPSGFVEDVADSVVANAG